MAFVFKLVDHLMKTIVMRLVTKEKQKEKNKGKTEKEEEALMMLYPCTKVVL